MAEKSFIVLKQGQGKDETLLKKFMTLEIMDLNDMDTITVGLLTSIDNIKVISLVDATDITVGVSANIITVNDALVSNSHVLLLVVGV